MNRGRILVFGFGGLLLLILASGLSSLYDLRGVATRGSMLREQLRQKSVLLDTVRDSVYLSGTFARDALFTGDPAITSSLKEEIGRLRIRAASSLASYPGEGIPHLVRDLKGELQVYWQVLGLMLEVVPRERRKAVDAYFYKELVARRDSMLSIVKRIDAVSEGQWRAEEGRLAQMHRDASRRGTLILALILALGAALASMAGIRLLRMEQATETQRRNLEDLSARLVHVQEEERKALARELHDGVGQSLSAVLVDVRQAARFVENPEALSHLETIRSLAERCLETVRDRAMSLRPSMLDDFGLVPALEWQCRELARRHGVEIDVDAEEPSEDLPEQHKTCIFRVAQEALSNAARHSGAQRLRLSFQQSRVSVTLSVVESGCGFDAARIRGLGLMGMRERVNRLGGSFQLSTQPGSGTRISVELPLAAEAAPS